MKVSVNDKCIGCNLCVEIGMGAFEMVSGQAAPTGTVDLNNKEIREAVKLSVEVCPVQAIEFKED